MTTVSSWRLLLLSRMLIALLLPLLSVGSYAADPDDVAAGADEYVAPHWSIALKGGWSQPDLDLYEEFYGSDKVGYFSFETAYRFTNWLELGAELGYSKDDGTGFLPNTGTMGGQVDYTLVPAQIFLNLRYEESARQLFVPYVGVGVAMAWYEQSIKQQDGVSGRTDIGYGARVGLELLLNRLDKRGANYVRGDRRFKTYFFLEAQVYSVEVDSIDLGGKLYLLGLRFDFDG